MNTKYVIFIFLMCATTYGQNVGVWYLKCDTTNSQHCGYVDSLGQVKIPFGNYSRCLSVQFKETALVEYNGKRIVIDRNEKVVYEAFDADGLQDLLFEERIRVELNGKLGFVNLYGELVVPTVYDYMLPFRDGMAFVNIGAKRIIEVGQPKWEGGRWGAINKEGKLIVPIKYTDVNFQSKKGGVLETSKIQNN